MGFESCHPAVNFLFFAAVLYGSVSFRHPAFLAISCLCACAYSVKRNGKAAAIFNLFLLPLVFCFALYYRKQAEKINRKITEKQQAK